MMILTFVPFFVRPPPLRASLPATGRVPSLIAEPPRAFPAPSLRRASALMDSSLDFEMLPACSLRVAPLIARRWWLASFIGKPFFPFGPPPAKAPTLPPSLRSTRPPPHFPQLQPIEGISFLSCAA